MKWKKRKEKRVRSEGWRVKGEEWRVKGKEQLGVKEKGKDERKKMRKKTKEE